MKNFGKRWQRPEKFSCRENLKQQNPELAKRKKISGKIADLFPEIFNRSLNFKNQSKKKTFMDLKKHHFEFFNFRT